MTSTVCQMAHSAANPADNPTLPIAKSRKSLPISSETSRIQSSNSSKIKVPSSSQRPYSQQIPNGLRRSVSVAAFSQSSGRNRSSIGPGQSPLSLTTGAKSMPLNGNALSQKSSRVSTSALSFKDGQPLSAPLIHTHDKLSSAAATRNSTGQYSIPSPSGSRSSSAGGSYSTMATTYDDEDPRRGRNHDAEELTKNGKRGSRVKEAKGNVIVSVRVRPDNTSSECALTEEEWIVDGGSSRVSYRGKEGGEYFYDNVFTAHDDNARVYDASAKRLVRRVMEGYHGTVFAYGMTGTGKTFSMQGTASSPGVIPLAITDIFSYIRETPHREFLLRVSYLEIYNEKIHDLLSAPPQGLGPGVFQQEEIKLREDSKRGVYATPLKEEIVQSPTQLLRVIARGDLARRTGSTQFNSRSSRSHAVVQIVVESRERVSPSNPTQDKRIGITPGGVRVSTLSLIDLAGSERAAETKERRAEGAHINKSLLTLGTVIARLSGDKDKNGNSTDRDGRHLPYRDSKLTRLLQPALSGNSLVSILCTIQISSNGSVASASTLTGETVNTLKFAARAKNNIVSHAKRAEEAIGTASGDAGSRVLLERYRMEIQTLKSQLDGQAKAFSDKETILEERRLEKEAESRHEEQMLEMQLARTALKERIEHLNRLILSSKSTGVNSGNGLFRASSNSIGGHDSGTMSLHSSGSQSTLSVGGVLNPSASALSLQTNDISPNRHSISRHSCDDEDDTMGEFADGIASLQMQVNALQADIADKNRYISTLERRLLQARRSSHSRMSLGFSHLKGSSSIEDPEVMTVFHEKDLEIAELRLQLDDKDRMVSALRSAARQREIARQTTESSFFDMQKVTGHYSAGSNDSSVASVNTGGPVSPVSLLSPIKLAEEKKRRSVDEVSRMLDEMIQDRVETGHVVRGARGSLRLPQRLQESTSPDGALAPMSGSKV